MLTSAMWSSWVEIHPKTGERLGIQQGDLVEIASPQGSVRAPAILSPGIAPDMVAMPVGQGHENFGRFASGRGANPLSILAPARGTRNRIACLGRDAGEAGARGRPRAGEACVVRGWNERLSARRSNRD